MGDVYCETCGYGSSCGWLLPCKNSDRCGQGRHLFCLDSTKEGRFLTPPEDLAAFPALQCGLCILTSAQGSAGRKRPAATAASTGKRGAQRGAKATTGAAPSEQAPPVQQQPAPAGGMAGQPPIQPAVDSATYGRRDQDTAFGQVGSVFARVEAQQDLMVGLEGNAPGGSSSSIVGRVDLGRSRSGSGQLAQDASGASVMGSGSLQQSHSAVANAEAAASQHPQQSSFDFSFVGVDMVHPSGSAAAGLIPTSVLGSTGSAAQQAAAGVAAASMAGMAAPPVGAAVTVCGGGDEEDQPLKRAKLQSAGMKLAKVPAGASSSQPAPAVYPSEPPPQQQQQQAQEQQQPQEQHQQAMAKVASTELRVPAVGTAAAAGGGTGTAVHGEGFRGGKPGGLTDRYKGQLKTPGRSTQLTDRPPPDVPQRGRRKPAAATATSATLAAGAHTPAAPAMGRLTADRPLDPALSAFDDLNSPPQKGATAGPGSRLQAASKLAGNTTLATAMCAAGRAGQLGQGVSGSGRPPLPQQVSNGVGSNGVFGTGNVAMGRGVAGAAGAAATGSLDGRIFGGTTAGRRMVVGVVPAARTRTATFDITKALSKTSSGSAGPSILPLQGSGSQQSTALDSLNSLPSAEPNPVETANNDRRGDGQGRRVDLWECDIPLDCKILPLQKGGLPTLKLIMQSISPHVSMARLCELLKVFKEPVMRQGRLKWGIKEGVQVPSIITATRDFYLDNAPCETCLVMYPKLTIGSAYGAFLDLLRNLKGTGRFLELEVPAFDLDPEGRELLRDPVLVRLLHALPATASELASRPESKGTFRLYFVPHHVPIDGVNFDNGTKDCLLCLTGSRKHIHLMSTWNRTPAAERGIKGILKSSKKDPASRRPVIFKNFDRNEHAEGRLLREKDGHAEGRLLREKDGHTLSAKLPRSTVEETFEVDDAAGEVAGEADKELQDISTAPGDAHKAEDDVGRAGEHARQTAGSMGCCVSADTLMAVGSALQTSAMGAPIAAAAEHVPVQAAAFGQLPVTTAVISTSTRCAVGIIPAAPMAAADSMDMDASPAAPLEVDEAAAVMEELTIAAATNSVVAGDHSSTGQQHAVMPASVDGNEQKQQVLAPSVHIPPLEVTLEGSPACTVAAGAAAAAATPVVAAALVTAPAPMDMLGAAPAPTESAGQVQAPTELVATWVESPVVAASSSMAEQQPPLLLPEQAPVPVPAPVAGAAEVDAAVEVLGQGDPSEELVSPVIAVDADATMIAATSSAESDLPVLFTWSITAAGPIVEQQAAALADVLQATSLVTSGTNPMADPAQQHPQCYKASTASGGVLQSVASAISSPEGYIMAGISAPQEPASSSDWCGKMEELLPVAASNQPSEVYDDLQHPHHSLQGQCCRHEQEPNQQQQPQQQQQEQEQHLQQQVMKMMDEEAEEGGHLQPQLLGAPSQPGPPVVLVPVVEDVPMGADSPAGNGSSCQTSCQDREATGADVKPAANTGSRSEGSESDVAMDLSDLGDGQEAGAVAEVAGAAGGGGVAGDMSELVPLDWRRLVVHTPFSDLGCIEAGVLQQAAGPPGELLDWRKLVSVYGPLATATEQQMVQGRPVQQQQQVPERCPNEQAASMAAGSWKWAKLSNHVLMSLQDHGNPCQELKYQLPHLIPDLRMIPTLPLRGFQLRLVASPAEAPQLQAALTEAAKKLGFRWSVWSSDTAPESLEGIQALALSKSVVAEISSLKALILKYITLHPIEMYRAETLVEGLQLLAQQQGRSPAGGSSSEGEAPSEPCVEAALRLAHSVRGIPAADCQPLYPLRVVVLLDAQTFLDTSPNLLRQLLDCLVHGSRTWGEPWQLQMRAADIAAVQQRGDPAHLSALASVQDPADHAEGGEGLLLHPPHPPQQQPRQQSVLRPLVKAAESTSTEMLVIKDALRLMHSFRPARLVIAAYAEGDGADAKGHVRKARKLKDVLAGTVREVVSFLDLLLANAWEEEEEEEAGGSTEAGHSGA